MITFGAILGQKSTDPDIWIFFNVQPVALNKEDRGTNDNYGSMIYKNHGLELVFGLKGDDLVLNSIWLMNAGEMEGGKAYAGVMPKKLKWNMSLDEVKQLLGEPTKEGGGTKHPLFGEIPKWLVYNYTNEFFINISFKHCGASTLCISYPE